MKRASDAGNDSSKFELPGFDVTDRRVCALVDQALLLATSNANKSNEQIPLFTMEPFLNRRRDTGKLLVSP